MRSTRDFFVGVVTGLSVGLLIAPGSGRESRQRLKEEYDKRTKSSGSSSGTGWQEQLTTAFEQIKEQVMHYVNQAKNQNKQPDNTGHFRDQSAPGTQVYNQGTSSTVDLSGTSELHEPRIS